jgi:hypothetical protein
MRTFRVAAALLLLALTLVSAQEAFSAMQPRAIQTVFPTDDIVIASLVVSAPADPAADAGPTIQAAVDEAAAAGGGVVFLPAGTWLLATPINVKEGVTLRGDWTPPVEGSAARGTLLAVTCGRGDADGQPAITMDRGAGLREVTVWYPEQNPMDIVPYPWALRGSTTVVGDNTTVMNVTLVNPYQGIKIGPEWNELHTIRNVYGTPLKAGFWNDFCTDIGRLIELDFGPRWWRESGLPGAPTGRAQMRAVDQFMRQEGVGVQIGRSDWEYLYRVRVNGYGMGFRFFPGEKGETNAVMYGCDATDCSVGLQIDALNGIGLSASGCTFAGFDAGILAPATFSTVAQFNTCTLSGFQGSAVRLEGRGALTFQNCTFREWEGAGLDARAGVVTCMGCSFARAGTAARLSSDVTQARLLGNTFTGEPRIENASPNDVEIAHTGFHFDRPDCSPHPAPPDRRPAGSALVVVTDAGAATGAEDNTAAFQAALDGVAAQGGGTVYVPAGCYRFAGHLTVPAKVELRGIFDVPHHTISAGSVLMPTEGRGDENGTPFIRLEAGSGLRGITVWYPEQEIAAIVPYPWAIQGLGPQTWLIDVTCSNAYQGVDLWTYPSTGHLVRYLAGNFYRRGLFVSKSDGPGWVEDIQFNPHYTARIPGDLPRSYPVDAWDAELDYTWKNLEALVIGRCTDEHLKGTFFFAARDGLVFRDDNGGANARVIQHGTDAGGSALVLEKTGERGVDLINTQLVHFGPSERAALLTTPDYQGSARFYNSQMWAGPRSGILQGPGEVLIQQLNTLTGAFTLSGGATTLENVHFCNDLRPHVRVETGALKARLIGNLGPRLFRVENQAAGALEALANSASVPVPPGSYEFATGFEAADPPSLDDTVATLGGGIRTVSDLCCHPVEGDEHGGSRALRVAGVANDPAYSYVYYRVFDPKLAVAPDSVLSYWLKPLNDRGRCVGVDLLFTDGTTLRDSGVRDIEGLGVHPGNERGVVGEWRWIVVPIGAAHAGKTIASIFFAYDSHGGGGPFEALVDDVRLASPAAGTAWPVEFSPAPGAYRGRARVALTSDAPAIRYTLDGTNPTAESLAYGAPILLDRPGVHEIRYATQAADGKLSPVVQGVLYEVLGE